MLPTRWRDLPDLDRPAARRRAARRLGLPGRPGPARPARSRLPAGGHPAKPTLQPLRPRAGRVLGHGRQGPRRQRDHHVRQPAAAPGRVLLGPHLRHRPQGRDQPLPDLRRARCARSASTARSSASSRRPPRCCAAAATRRAGTRAPTAWAASSGSSGRRPATSTSSSGGRAARTRVTRYAAFVNEFVTRYRGQRVPARPLPQAVDAHAGRGAPPASETTRPPGRRAPSSWRRPARSPPATDLVRPAATLLTGTDEPAAGGPALRRQSRGERRARCPPARSCV